MWTVPTLDGHGEWLGVYDHPPPEGAGLSTIEIPEASLFEMDASLLRGAAQATEYRDRLRAWFEEHGP